MYDAPLAYHITFGTYGTRLLAEELIEKMCPGFGWRYHISACQPDHVHTLLTTDFAPKPVRKL